MKHIWVLYLIVIIIITLVCLYYQLTTTAKIKDENSNLILYLNKESIFKSENFINNKPNLTHYEPCTIFNLQLCTIGEPVTICNPLLNNVKCHHFAQDTNYYINGSVVATVPANLNLNEGYALNLNLIAPKCNSYHGDFTLLPTQDNAYMLVCVPKHPGLIGNSNILGSADVVYMCNGKIDNINQPINKIKCICTYSYEYTKYINDIPTCVEYTIDECNKLLDKDLMTLIIDNIMKMKFKDEFIKMLPLAKFNSTLRNRMNCDKLPNPCNFDIFMTPLINGQYNETLNSCIFQSTDCIPVENNKILNSDLLHTALALSPNSKIQNLRLIAPSHSSVTLQNGVTLVMPKIINYNNTFIMNELDTTYFYGFKCKDRVLRYDVMLMYQNRHLHKVNNEFVTAPWEECLLGIGCKTWRIVNDMNVALHINKEDKLTIKKSDLDKYDVAQMVGYQYGSRNTIVCIKTLNDWLIHKVSDDS